MTRSRSSFRRMVSAFLWAPTGIVSAVTLTALLALAVMGPDGFGANATQLDVANASLGRGADHPLGTDGLGRDILARTLAATRTSIGLAVLAVTISVVAGTMIGGLLATSGARIRRIGGSIIDTLMSFGDILLAVVVVAIVGVGAKGAVIAVGVAFTPAFARFTYSVVSSVMVRDYVAAASVVGVRRSVLLRRYVLLNIVDSLAVTGFIAVGESIIALSSLSFLGLGVQSPDFDWGQMLTDGVRNFYVNPWAAVAPAVMIAGTGLVVALFGDALARAVNPVLWDERPRLLARFRGQVRGRTAPRIDSPDGSTNSSIDDASSEPTLGSTESASR